MARCSDIMDRLGMLPDDILTGKILPFLPTIEAVRTSILGRRWRCLWSCVPNMKFDGLEEVACVSPRSREHTVASKYAGWVYRVINAYRGPAPLREFSICFHLDESFSGCVDSWLTFALQKGTEVLELNGPCIGPYRSPYCFTSIDPLMFPNLRLLKSLILKTVAADDESLEHLLQGCQLLEMLRLHDLCSLSRVSITGPMSRLKCIDISGCWLLKSIMISAPTPDLVSFTYPMDSQLFQKMEFLHIEHAPQLVELSIGDGEDGHFNRILSHPLRCYLSQLQSLNVNIMDWKNMVMHWLPHLPDLSGLKHLSLSLEYCDDMQDVHGVTSLINAAPCLRRLTLNVDYLPNKLKIPEESADLHLPSLRVIELNGFTWSKVQPRFVLYLIKGVLSLEKLIIDSRDPSLIINKEAFTKKKLRRLSRRALEFKQCLPSGVKQVFLLDKTEGSIAPLGI